MSCSSLYNSTNQSICGKWIAAVALLLSLTSNGQAVDTLQHPQPAALQLLNTVTVTATRMERSTLETDRSVSILSRKILDTRTPRSTPEALFQETGIWVQKTNHGGGSPVIRGMMGNQVLLLVDGIRMNNATYRFGPNQYLNTIDPYMLNRLEAVRGGGSVLYGSDAMGGVIHAFSRDPEFSRGADFTITGGQVSAGWMSAGMEGSGNLRVDAGNERFALSAAGSLFQFGDIVAGGSLGTLTPSGYRQQSGSFRARIKLSPNSTLLVAHQDLIQHRVPRYDQVLQGGYQQYEFNPQGRRLDFLRLENRSEAPWARKFILTLFNGATMEGLTTRKTGSNSVKDQLDKVATAGFTAEVESQPLRGWSIRSGAEYYHDFVRSTALTSDLSTGAISQVRGAYATGSTSASTSIYTSHQVDLNRFNLTGGLRYTHVALRIRDQLFGNQQIAPNALVSSWSAGWKISQPVRLYSSLHAGFRAPNIDDLSKFGTVESGIFEIPASGLKPERSLSKELGLKVRTRKLGWSAAWYQTRVSELIDRVPTLYQGSSTFEGRAVYQKMNTGEARYTGLEAEAEWLISGQLTLSGNVTRTYGQNMTKHEPARRIPPLFGRLALRYVTGNFSFMVTTNQAGKQTRLASGDRSDARIALRLVNGVMPGWNTLDIAAEWTKGPWSVNLNLRNLGNTEYRIYGSGVDGYGRHAVVRLSRRLLPSRAAA